MSEKALPTVRITYCTQCNWMLRAGWMAQELLSTFGVELGEVVLVPGSAAGDHRERNAVSRAEGAKLSRRLPLAALRVERPLADPRGKEQHHAFGAKPSRREHERLE